MITEKDIRDAFGAFGEESFELLEVSPVVDPFDNSTKWNVRVKIDDSETRAFFPSNVKELADMVDIALNDRANRRLRVNTVINKLMATTSLM